MEISKIISDKIKYLCKSIPEDEWSGILLYEVKGTIKDVENMSLIVKDIIPMNKGSQTYTEYDFVEVTEYGVEDKMMDYIEKFPEAMKWKLGHIHSHNTMSVFFSATDISELHDNVGNHDFYLSLIINNWGDYQAKVATKGTPTEPQVVEYTANDENGKPYVIAIQNKKETNNAIFIYDCDIEKADETSLEVDDFFAENVKDIIQKAVVKQTYTKPGHYNQSYNKTSFPQKYGSSIKYNGQGGSSQKNLFSKPHPQSDFTKARLNEFEDFLKSLLLGLTDPMDDSELFDLNDVITQIGVNIQVNQITALELSSVTINNYFNLYDYYFGRDDDNEVILFSDKIISILDDYRIEYPFLKATISGLKSLLINYIKNDKYT